jgi:predicted ArsR family transcriptional regulator
MTKTPTYTLSAHLHKNKGLTPAQIAERTGLALKTVQVHLWKARKAGLLPPSRRNRRARGGREAWEYYHGKGAAISRGSVGDLLDELTHDEIEALLHMIGPEDISLATMLARMVKEHLHARTG